MMARKRSSIKRPQKPQHNAKADTPKSIPPDRRALEKTIADLSRILNEHEFESIDEINAFTQSLLESGQPIDMPGDSPLEQAQDLMYKAFDAQGTRRIRLARRALTISEDCADAYVLLAEEAAKSLEETKDLYEKGVTAGERALGTEMFEENAGHFWGIIQTRPYMRARAGLAGCLYALGQREEAAAHYQDMLRLNPNDNQGIRYSLANLLLELERYDDFDALFEQYPDEYTAAMTYPRALATFQREGASKAAVKQLKTALSRNRFVPMYLLGERKLPRYLPEYIGVGDEDEAISYVASARSTWERNPAALDWLRRTVKGE